MIDNNELLADIKSSIERASVRFEKFRISARERCRRVEDESSQKIAEASLKNDQARQSKDREISDLKIAHASEISQLKASHEADIEKIRAELNAEISRLKSEAEAFESERNAQHETRTKLDIAIKEAAVIPGLRDEITRLKDEIEKKSFLEKENQRIRRDYDQLKEEYFRWKATLKDMIKKMGLF